MYVFDRHHILHSFAAEQLSLLLGPQNIPVYVYLFPETNAVVFKLASFSVSRHREQLTPAVLLDRARKVRWSAARQVHVSEVDLD